MYPLSLICLQCELFEIAITLHYFPPSLCSRAPHPLPHLPQVMHLKRHSPEGNYIYKSFIHVLETGPVKGYG